MEIDIKFKYQPSRPSTTLNTILLMNQLQKVSRIDKFPMIKNKPRCRRSFECYTYSLYLEVMKKWLK